MATAGEHDNLKANHYQKRSDNVSDFEKFEEFKKWYHNQMQEQENKCYYCGIEEEKYVCMVVR